MPWSKTNLPPSASKLKGRSVAIFVAVANQVLKDTKDEGRAVASGMAAVKRYKEKRNMTTQTKKAVFAYKPDPENPSTWKLDISDARHTAAAVAALGKGFRGNKVEIPAKDVAVVKRRVAAAYKKFFPDNDVPPILKALDIKVNDAPVDDALFGVIVRSIANFFRQKEYEEECTDMDEMYAEAELMDMQEDAAEDDMADVQVMKAHNQDLRQATFTVLEADVVDLHGDTYSAEEVAKACHNFWTFCQKAYLDHSQETEEATIVENYIAPVDMIIGDEFVAKGSWLQVWQFNETLWPDVKAGKYNGVSIGAYCTTEDITE